MRVGIAHHYGWAVAVVVGDDDAVVERRRLELIGPGVPAAPVHHEGGPHPMHRTGPALSDDELAALVAKVRASVVTTTAASLDALPPRVTALALQRWDPGFPTDISTQRRAPYEARADSVMYRQVLDELARGRGWDVHLYDAKTAEADAEGIVGAGALHAPRARLGAPWTKDHRLAFAAAILAR